MSKRKLLSVNLLLAFILALSCVFIGSAFASGKHNVTFRSEIGGFDDVTVEVDDGNTVLPPQQITRLGYEVTWYHGDQEYDFSAPVTSDLLLTASWEKKEDSYQDSQGNPFVWQFDSNGISTQLVYKNGAAIPYYGMYDPTNCYYEGEDGSIFVLAGAYMVLGGELDVSKPINIIFQMDPNKAWSAFGTGRFLFTLYDSYEQLFYAGPEGWNPANGAMLISWGSLSNTDPAWPYHRITAGTGYSDEFDYTNSMATFTIFIAEDVSESFVALNGKKFASIDLCRSDFIDGTATLSMTVFDAPLEAKMRIDQSEGAKVTFMSNVSEFSEYEIFAAVGSAIEQPVAPSIAGYTFEGWYCDEQGIKPFEFDTLLSGDTVIYAKYLNNSKDYAKVTLRSLTGNYSVLEFTAEKGAKIKDPGNVFGKEGYSVQWMKDGQPYDFDTVVNSDMVLIANWIEDTLVLYHKMSGVIDTSYMYEYLQDENGWDMEYTDWQKGDTFVDEYGNEVISSFYGSYWFETHFVTGNEYTTFLLVGVGSITNLKRLDVTKEIEITYSVSNWDTTNNNNPWDGDITFHLFDTILSALKCPNPGDTGALVAIKTSTLPSDPLYGKFQDLGTGATSEDMVYENDKVFRILIYISEDGTGNYLKVNDQLIEGALAGVKQSDFVGGYAYLHIGNFGSTHQYKCLVAQKSRLTIAESENGTVEADLTGEVFFKRKVTLTLTPDENYRVKKVTVGGKEYAPNAQNKVEFYKGWDDETVEVEFAREFIMTFNTMGGSAIAPQSVSEGELFYRPANPRREGYNFEGWYIDQDYTQEYDFTRPATADVTIYAKWSKKEGANSDSSGCGCNGSVSDIVSFSILGLFVLSAALLFKKKSVK